MDSLWSTTYGKLSYGGVYTFFSSLSWYRSLRTLFHEEYEPCHTQLTGANTASYPLSRTFRSSARLNLQHFLHKKDLGWVVHPSICLQGDNLKVADVGTGTGIWLTDLRDDLPESSTLDGFDISDEQYPPDAWLPSNLHLSVRDIFADVPAKLTGRYDLINIRFFTCVVRKNDPHVIIQHVFKMLKPGGYLQWIEYDGLNESNLTAPGVSDAAWHALKREVEVQTKSGTARFQWLSELVSSLELAGFTDVIKERKYARKDNYSSWQQSTLMVAEEMSYSVPDGHRIRELVQKNLVESPKGVYWNRPHLIFVAKKPHQ